ncbi:MAG: tetratricopeptide repeat protein [Acidobacteria bacterium]|nr:tetratricopeptide repeat protein [Acidobacteriota bacterium]MCA1612117.1 tetratricopeptide repeat protein [Acidobacteriota bacterium]
MSDPGTATPTKGRLASAFAPLFVGLLLGFIGGYFAGGAGQPAGGGALSASVAAAGGAADALRAEIARDPENPRLWTALGNAYYDAEDWDQAVDAYEKALRKAPKDAALLSDLAAAYRNRGEFRRAIATFERARAADPARWQALLNLVLIHAFDEKDSAAAQRALDELKRKYPDIPNIDRIQEQISRLRAG